MQMKKLITAISLAAVMAVPAVAQDTKAPSQAAPSASRSADEAVTTTPAERVLASKLLNESVRNKANETIGDINDVVIDKSGKVAQIIVGVGGFLGLGEKDVALSFDQLSFATDNDGDLTVTTEVTKESLQSAPAYEKPGSRRQ
jgi:sporulation protein YlmC with PRC-barrel domain